MRKLIFISALLLIVACQDQSKMDPNINPFFQSWDTAYEVPPFMDIKDEHYMPAYEKGMEENLSEIDLTAGLAWGRSKTVGLQMLGRKEAQTCASARSYSGYILGTVDIHQPCTPCSSAAAATSAHFRSGRSWLASFIAFLVLNPL